MTLKDIEDILINDYGRDTGDRMPVSEVDQILATLKSGCAVMLHGAGMAIVPEGGPGLYCAYVKPENQEGS
jgi:hypothetical protein